MKSKFGDRIIVSGLGEKLVRGDWTIPFAQPPLQVNRWVRNPKHPNALFESMKREQATQCALYRTKEYFGGLQMFPPPTNPAGNDEQRSRFAFHSGPYAHAACAIVWMSSPSHADLSSYGQLDLSTSNTHATTAATATFASGAAPTATTQGWAICTRSIQYLDISPDTAYYGLFTQYGRSRILCATVFELSSLTENFSGYLSQNIAAQTPILDVYREQMATITRAMWRRGASRTFHWENYITIGAPFVDGDGQGDGGHAQSTSSTTEVNILDTGLSGVSSTTVTANTPGPTFVMNNKDRLMQTAGVPMVMKGYGSMSTAVTGGLLKLKDSSGTAIATISNAWNNTPSWQSVTFNMPATTAKYDLHYASLNAAHTFRLNALDIYEHET